METKTKTRNISVISQLEHSKRSATSTGSKKRQEIEIYAYSHPNIFTLEKISFTPTLNKIIDEVIVNAIDHWTIYPRLVKNIVINLTETGEISVLNDGPGIVVVLKKNLMGVEMYTPQMIASEFHSGDNFNDDRITGGANGLGLKLTNAHSDYLILETIDETHKVHYIQRFLDELETIEEPVLTKTNKKGFTKITFMPVYAKLGYHGGFDHGRDYADMFKLIQSRAYQACAFTSANIIFNDEKIMETIRPRDRFGALVQMFLDHTPLSFTLRATHPFEVHIGVSDGKFRQFSIINGVCAYGGGNHIKYLQGQIIQGIRPRVEKIISKTKQKFSPNYITNNLFIFVKGSIPNPEWGGGNIKSHIGDPIEKFNEYKFSDTDIRQIWELLEEPVMTHFIKKTTTKKSSRVVRTRMNIKKCEEAIFAGRKNLAMDCTLIICEGDSAQTMVYTGISSAKTDIDCNYYGTFNIQGVPINARKQITRITIPGTKRSKIVRRPKLSKNERFDSLCLVLNLNYDLKYDTDEEFQTLRYGRVIVATDQDEDGKGQIFGLIANFFELFWPALIARGYVCRMNTPIVKAMPRRGGAMFEFYTEEDYKKWVIARGGVEVVNSAYRTYYYKGLGTHEAKEVIQLFQRFEEKIITFRLDEKASETMEIYFGENTSGRKKALIVPVIYREIHSTSEDISTALNIDTKSFQQDNNRRKLLNAIDGLVPSRRKILFYAMHVFAHSLEKKRVSSFVGGVIEKTGYHHGDASLVKATVRMAQCFKGARILPYLYPKGQFGSRMKGGKDYASERYIYTNLNRKFCFQLFPKCDEALLNYELVEGERFEPTYYVPILPMAVLDSITQPTSGFKIEIWARDVYDVIENVRNMIMGGVCRDEIKIHNTGGELRYDERGNLYSFGNYTFNSKTGILIITELPIGKFNYHIYGEDGEGRMRPELVEPMKELSTDDDIHIEMQFKLECIPEIEEKYGNPWCDCFEDYLGLKNPLHEILTMYNKDGYIIEYKNHADVIRDWFEERKRLYGERIDREIILCEMRILKLENTIRFIENHLTYKISSKMSRERVVEILERNNYIRINNEAFANVGEIKTENIKNSILVSYGGTEANYNYLIDLRYGDLLDKSRQAKLKRLRTEREILAELLEDNTLYFKGAKTWLRELDEIEKTIRNGVLETLN